LKAGKSEESYRDWIKRSSTEHHTRVILALDLEGNAESELLEFGEALLNDTDDYLCGVRFGRQTVLNLGPSLTRRLTKRVHESGLPCIIDDKLSDIGPTNEAIARAYYRLGFDAIIVNPSSGWKGGLEPVFRLSHERGQGVIVLAYMSHPGASETFGQRVFNGGSRRPTYQYEKYARKAVEWDSDGVVVGATRPKIIRKLKPILKGKVPIYSPGVGAQGGDIAAARKAGSDYFIIGRSITKAHNPVRMSRQFARASLPV
jgi:orotidine-5'-phosphate decarboxylase